MSTTAEDLRVIASQRIGEVDPRQVTAMVRKIVEGSHTEAAIDEGVAAFSSAL